ncbi:Putative phosphoinositide phosphatase [Phaffia rhodozyma]|uniref:Putative phosphoinositide phosphatase n=1 Tax=Phaffia rhodozyma TaxID=264483 RepID=A0A0F7SKH1_PHARH|nr:Putative phosphoinositide phosphatase [Phaffia rhodozyma]
MDLKSTTRSIHQSLNLYISNDAYVFQSALRGDLNDKMAGLDTLVIDRMTGSIVLNPTTKTAPVATEQILTVHGILGIISLAMTDYLIVITQKTHSCKFLDHDIYQVSSHLLLPLSPLDPARLYSPYEAQLQDLVQQGLDSARLFFSYTFDLTNTLERQWRQVRAAGGEDRLEGLQERADDRFFWNLELMRKFLDVGRVSSSGRAVSVDPAMSQFILPVMYGNFELRQTEIGSQPILLALISRRSRHRSGTRFFTRGIDHDGNTANYVETEQIVLFDKPSSSFSTPNGQISDDKHSSSPGLPDVIHGRERFSFVQVRGSAPIFWAQVNNLRYTPDLQVMALPETAAALQSHLSEQIVIYGDVHLVNLVNQVKYERPIKEALENAMLVVNEPRAKYMYFDFHKECKGMKFENVQSLIDRLREDLDKEGYFHYSSPSESAAYSYPPKKFQISVIRTNCMFFSHFVPEQISFPEYQRLRSLPFICGSLQYRHGFSRYDDAISQSYNALKLKAHCRFTYLIFIIIPSQFTSTPQDRTNVVQSALARDVLDRQLRSSRVLTEIDSVEHHPEFMHVFRNIWADHADVVSIAYSGTGALKTDFTRTGKRSSKGAAMDGWNSVVRYVKNNYLDGSRQDALDLLTGAWSVRRGSTSPFVDTRPILMRIMPTVLSTALGCVCLIEFYAWWWLIPISWTFFWAASIVTVLSFLYIWANGIYYVDWPRLNPPIEILNYDGPGYRSTPRGRGAGSTSAVVSRFIRAISIHRVIPFLGRSRGAARGRMLSGGGGVGESHARVGSIGGIIEEAPLRRKGREGRLD